MIGDERFGVQHWSAEFEDAGARVQQLAVSGARKDADNRDVGGAWQQQTHIHAAAGRVDESGIQCRWGDEVRVGNPEPFGDGGRQ